ncbi:MAG: DUF1080 domain-containing protein [Halobacteriaceae archaeon]
MGRSDWVDLFDGESLDGWGTVGDADSWSVADGCIVCGGGDGGYLHTERRFEDFDLEVEFEMTEGANSGVFVRWSDLSNPVHTGLELQILDTAGEPQDRHSCGALYDMVAPAADAARPPGEWNRMAVTCEGSTLRETLNGTRVVDADLSRWDTPGENPDGTENKFENAWAEMPRRGHVGLQDHGDEVRFRSVRVRER